MKDFVYNIETQDWDIQDGEFVFADEVSDQNGGIILLARAFNSSNPILGIGINQVRGGSVLQANFEMNRWVQQVRDDGGKAAVSTKTDAQLNTIFTWTVDY